MTSPDSPGAAAPIDVIRRRARTAFTAAAYGDALGWPNESRGKTSLKKSRTTPSTKLVSWRRREGGPALAHSEEVPAGTYSDDTQLIIALARCYLASGSNWWDRFTRLELPFWRFYQRGGGGATLRAARSWGEGKFPWESLGEQYFQAGGNGVAMRVLPHVVRYHAAESFDDLLGAVLLDGIATHGHPRALVGASMFAYAAWLMIRRRNPLEFGQLVSEVITDVHLWSAPPCDVKAFTRQQPVSWSRIRPDRDLWSHTVHETIELLEIVRDAMGDGALFVDRPTLDKLGALGQQRGSGVVSAVAAVFLASRYATDPAQGVIEAAFAAGADTDTLASMTATLLACVSEGAQLGHLARDVQDRVFLESLADELMDGKSRNGTMQRDQIFPTSSALEKWTKSLMTSKGGQEVTLPDGRQGIVESALQRTERNLSINEGAVRAVDGQTLRFKRIQKNAATTASMFDDAPPARPTEAVPATRPPDHAGKDAYAFAPELVLRCRDLDRTILFYERLLGLRVYDDRRPRAQHVRLEGSLSFVAADEPAEVDAQISLEIRLRVRGAETVYKLLAKAGFPPQPFPYDRLDSATIVRDPDGRTVMLIPVR